MIFFLLIILDHAFLLISRLVLLLFPLLILVGCDQELLFETLFDREEEIETQMGVGARKTETEILGVLGKEKCADVLLVMKVLLDEAKATSRQALEETRSAAPPLLLDHTHAFRKVVLAEDGQQR